MATRIRIQKYLSEHGITSRRKAEEWIKAGYIFVNGRQVTELGTKLDPGKDSITFAPEVRKKQEYQYYLYNKPQGVVTVNAVPGEQEIKDLVEVPRSVVPVGRLDKDSSGLILLTNDGVVARRIMDPQFAHEKEYEVTFTEPISDMLLRELASGVILFGQRTLPVDIRRVGRDRVRMVLTEGKNRQIRRMAEAIGHKVKDLRRVRILHMELRDMKPGELIRLSRDKARFLYQALKLDESHRKCAIQ